MVAESTASNKSLEASRISLPKEKARRKRKPGVPLPVIILATAIGATTTYEDPRKLLYTSSTCLGMHQNVEGGGATRRGGGVGGGRHVDVIGQMVCPLTQPAPVTCRLIWRNEAG